MMVLLMIIRMSLTKNIKYLDGWGRLVQEELRVGFGGGGRVWGAEL